MLDSHRLTPTQRRIAQCLVANADRAAFLTGPELATLADTSTPSVTRLAVALGYSGYPQFREKIRATLGTQTSPEGTGGAHANKLQSAVAQDARSVRQLADALADPRQLIAAGSVLAGSPTLIVLGLRVSAPVASYFAYFARKVHPDVRLLTSAGSYLDDLLDQACQAGATAMIVFLMPRWPRETISAIKRAHDRGLAVIAITDHNFTPIKPYCQIVLPAEVGMGLTFDSHAGPISLSTAVLEAMCDALPAGQVQKRLDEFERNAQQRRIFVT